jgi:hypothetical protein
MGISMLWPTSCWFVLGRRRASKVVSMEMADISVVVVFRVVWMRVVESWIVVSGFVMWWYSFVVVSETRADMVRIDFIVDAGFGVLMP